MVRISTLLGLGFTAATAFAAPTHVLSRRDNACPFNDPDAPGTFTMKNDKEIEYTIKIKFSEASEVDCTYDVLEASSSTPDAPTLPNFLSVKTPQNGPRTLRWFAPNELNALKGIKEFVTYGRDVETHREWLVTKRHPGQHVMLTEAWKKQFGGYGYNKDATDETVPECKVFMRKIYDLVAKEGAAMITRYGWSHNSLDWNNFKFSDDLEEVYFVNWAQAEYITHIWPVYADREKLQISEGLEFNSRLPIFDLELSNSDEIQGVCDSDLRDVEDVAWVNPYPNVFKPAMTVPCTKAAQGAYCIVQ